MSKPQIKEYNCETSQEIVRDATAAEIAQLEKNAIESARIKAEAEAKAAEKQALLDRLGITADEAKLLLG
jgi:hypothetical protein